MRQLLESTSGWGWLPREPISDSVQSLSYICPTLWDPMDCSSLSFPVYHQQLELTQTHVHRVGDAIQPSHPLSSPSLPAFSLSQHQGVFQWVSSSHQVAEVLELQLWHQSFQWIFRIDFLQNWLVWSLVVQGTLKSLLQPHDSKASVLIKLHNGPSLTSLHDYWKNHSFGCMDLYWQSDVSAFWSAV